MAKTARPRKAKQQSSELRTPGQFFRGAKLMVDDDPPVDDEFSDVKDHKQRLYLRAIAQIPRHGRACRAAGISVVTAWHWRNGRNCDPSFPALFELAWKLGIERCEGEFFRRGFEGYEKPVYQNGKLVGTVREFDTTAGIFMLKGALPEKYRDRYEHSGPNGGPIPVAPLTGLSVDELRERMRSLLDGLQAQPASGPGETSAPSPVDGPAASQASERAAYAKTLAERVRGNGQGGPDGKDGSGGTNGSGD